MTGLIGRIRGVSLTYLLLREAVYDLRDLMLTPCYGGGQSCPSLSHPARQTDGG